MKKERIIKSGAIFLILGSLVYYKYDIKTAVIAVLMLFTINVTVILIPDLVLVALKRKSADTVLYLRLILWFACLAGCIVFMPMKVAASIAVVSLVVSGVTTSMALKNSPCISQERACKKRSL